MAYTQADLDELQKSIAAGVLTVKHRERQVTYQSRADMAITEAKMLAQLGQGGIRRNNPTYSNGY